VDGVGFLVVQYTQFVGHTCGDKMTGPEESQIAKAVSEQRQLSHGPIVLVSFVLQGIGQVDSHKRPTVHQLIRSRSFVL
jgi:hypothetical protein